MIKRTLGIALALAFMWLTPASAEGLRVVASIKPVHSLVAAVMDGVSEPYLIVKGGASPHSYSLKPSDARALERAQVVFWVGEEFERFLERSVHSLAKDAEIVWMIDAANLTRLGLREGGSFATHAHHAEPQKGGHEGHDHGSIDMHLWLNPINSKAMVAEILQALETADPDNASRYKANAQRLIAELDALDREIASALTTIKDVPFIVFHDSFQYFEQRYGLTAAGSITLNPEAPPGARRVKEMRENVQKLGAACVFAEPQFDPGLVTIITKGSQARAGVLDPLGANLEEGPRLYFSLLRNVARSMTECLSP